VEAATLQGSGPRLQVTRVLTVRTCPVPELQLLCECVETLRGNIETPHRGVPVVVQYYYYLICETNAFGSSSLAIKASRILQTKPGPSLVAKNFANFFNISRHIESLDACMKH
jgi:hypothetical protein